MADRTRVPTNLPKFTGKRGKDVHEWLFQIENACRINSIPIEDASTRLPGIAGLAMEKPASGWFLHWSSTSRSEEHTWFFFREHELQHFEASNYQAILHEKLQRLKQTADIEPYNGEYSALIFHVEGMSMLDQVFCYANGLKPRTRSYVKLENPETLSDAMNLAVKYEVTHFVDDTHERQPREDKKHCGATMIYESQRWAEEHQLQTTKFDDKNIRVKLGDNQIIQTKLEVLPLNITASGIQDAYKCVAVVYAIPDKFDCILGIPFFEDVQPQIDWRGRRIKGTGIKTLRWEQTGEAYGPIEEGRPVIAPRLRRSVEAKVLSAKRPDPCRGAALETDVTSAAGPARDVAQEKSPGVFCEQQEDAPAGKGSAASDGGKSSGRGGTAGKTEGSSSARGKDNVVEKMFTMGVVDESGVQTEYITRKKLRKLLRIKTKSADEPDVMLVLTNETIKQVARSLQRRDQPDNIATAEVQRYLETDWDSFRSNPAFDLLVES
ncbi:hypothetical protein PC117_g18793 [Phytophthora cactorum]|uniref:Ty3 transposon capsid-like protein domain-containing protein n=1 Tax=Phytophthora cactorum TaxID=29920 RepID=A0A8T1C2X2_9STRA|nr:hypothetical protein PC117_g18793 [Phytophthora cactorum]